MTSSNITLKYESSPESFYMNEMFLNAMKNHYKRGDEFSLKTKIFNRDDVWNYFHVILGMNYKFSTPEYFLFYTEAMDLVVIVSWDTNVRYLKPDRDDPFSISIYGSREMVEFNFERFRDAFKLESRRKPSTLQAWWAYLNANGSLAYTTLPIKDDNVFYPELYPFIPDVNKFIDDYAKSSSNVLILFGEPGLGKTHLMHAIAHQVL